MVKLREYLDGTAASEDTKDLIELIADQAPAIRAAFITNQAYADRETSPEEQAAMDVWADRHSGHPAPARRRLASRSSRRSRFPDARIALGS